MTRVARIVVVITMLAAPALASAPAPAIVMLTLNGRELGTLRVDVDNADYCVPLAVLRDAGLAWQSAATAALDGDLCVWLTTMRPIVAVIFDDASATLHLTAGPELFAGRHTIRMASVPPTLERINGTSMFINYAVGADRHGGARYASELGINLGSAVLQANVSGEADRRLERGPATLVIDDERRMARWRLGDLFGGANVRSGVVPMAGISVSREYAIDPYFVRYAPLSLSGASATPATAEVYVNGQLVSRQRVSPGRFELADLPAPVGAGSARVVIRDDFGRTQELATTFYRAPSVIGNGEHEYHYAAGVRRRSAFDRLWDYGGLVGAAQHRMGVTDALTLGGRVEASGDIISGGPSVVVSTMMGEVGVEASASRSRSADGGAGALSYSYRASRASVGATARYFSRAYRDLIVDDTASRSDLLAWGGVSVLRHVGLSLQATSGELWSGERRTTAGLTMNVSLTGGAAVTASVIRSRIDGRDGHEGLLLLTVPLGSRASMTAGAMRTRDGATATLSAQRSLPIGPGLGYRLQWQDRGASMVTGAIEAQSSFGRVHVQHDRWPTRSQSGITVSGALVAAAGGLHVTRPIDDAFAVLRVPGVKGVKAFLSNQYVGRTGRQGSLIVPSLVSYYGNRLSIAPDDLPLDVSLSRHVALVAPSFRGGARVTFAATAAWPVIGTFELLRNGERVIPAYGSARMIWTTGQAESPIGDLGEFFFEGVPPGRHDVEIKYTGESFTCSVHVPVLTNIGNVGTVTCVPTLCTRWREP